jgi:hypothetical protein
MRELAKRISNLALGLLDPVEKRLKVRSEFLFREAANPAELFK